MPNMIVTDEVRRLRAIRALHCQNVSTGERLIDLADTVLQGVEEIDLDGAYPEDECHEIADSAVPVYTSTIAETVREDIGLMTAEPELGPAFDGSPTPINLMAANLYELASNIAFEALEARRREALEDDE